MNIQNLPELTLLHEANEDIGAVYAQIHALDGPGFFRSPDGDGLIITSYAALQSLRKSPDLQSLKRAQRIGGSGELGSLAQISAYTPFFADEPLHTPLAAATQNTIGPRRRQPMSKRFNSCVTGALVQMRNQVTNDLVEDLAQRVARSFWMGELGATADMDRSFRDWSAAIFPMLAFECTEAQVAAANQAAAEMWDYLLGLEKTADEDSLLLRVARELSHLPDSPIRGADLIAAITFDGIDSAASAIANVLYVILQDDALQTLLRQNPGQIDNAVREALRLETPLPSLQRATTAPVTFADVEIPEGVNILMAWGCGNRDPNAYIRPNEFMLERKNRTILSFGGGKRFCKGRTMSLIQCSAVLKLLFENTQWIDLQETPVWSPPGSMRTIKSLQCQINFLDKETPRLKPSSPDDFITEESFQISPDDHQYWRSS